MLLFVDLIVLCSACGNGPAGEFFLGKIDFCFGVCVSNWIQSGRQRDMGLIAVVVAACDSCGIRPESR